MYSNTYLPGRNYDRTFPASQRQLDFLRSLREEIARLKNATVALEAQVTGDALANWISTADVAADKAKCSKKIEEAIAWRDRLRVEAKELRAQAPRTADEAAVGGRREVTEGMWIVGDLTDGHVGNLARIFKVQQALDSDRLYAKELIRTEGDSEHDSFVYTPGAMKTIAQFGRKMTLDEAKQYGALYGTCCVCGRRLTNEKSIAAKIGPVCAKKFS